MSCIYLIRHGQTDANEQHLYYGSTDVPLSEKGIAELGKLSYHVGKAGFVTSGMKRTVQTLRILFGDVPYEVEPKLREMNFGDFEMHSYEELKDNPDYQVWISGDNEANITPHGESGIQLRQRALEAFTKIRNAEQDTVIVTHGGVIAAIMDALFPEEHKNRYQWQPKPGYGYCLTDSGYQSIP